MIRSFATAIGIWHCRLDSRTITPSQRDLEFFMVGIMSPQSAADNAELIMQFQRHHDRLRGILERLLGQQFRRYIDPEDLLQNVYLRAQKRWLDYRARGLNCDFPILYRLTRDLYVEECRRLTVEVRYIRHAICIPESSAMVLVEALMADGTTPSEALDRKDVRQLMFQTLKLLRPEYREILTMLYFDGLSVKEASQVLGITYENASQRHCRALKKLKGLWMKVNRELP
jgi:RNA polymerase sigma-70 factor (ECF subfamily)